MIIFSNLIRIAALISLGLFIVFGGPTACGDDDDGGTTDGDSDGDTDGDTDGDSDGDSDPEVDCSECTDPLCMGSISGTVMFRNSDGDVPLADDMVQICTSSCMTTPTNENGEFSMVWPGGCKGFNFAEGDAKPHIVLLHSAGTHAKYSAEYTPEQSEIDDNFDFDTGTHYMYELPDTGFDYVPADGVTVMDEEGLTFSVDAGNLGTDPLEVKVLKFPLDEWEPPFLHGNVPDALYFVGPYFIDVTGGLPISIDAASIGWTDGDEGSIWFLGDFSPGFLSCTNFGDEDVPQGEWVDCEAATTAGGSVSGEISKFGWFGVIKN